MLPCETPGTRLTHASYLNPVNFTTLEPPSPSPHAYAAFAIHQTLYSLLSEGIKPNGRSVLTDSTSLATSSLVEEAPFPAKNPGPPSSGAKAYPSPERGNGGASF